MIPSCGLSLRWRGGSVCATIIGITDRRQTLRLGNAVGGRRTAGCRKRCRGPWFGRAPRHPVDVGMGVAWADVAAPPAARPAARCRSYTAGPSWAGDFRPPDPDPTAEPSAVSPSPCLLVSPSPPGRSKDRTCATDRRHHTHATGHWDMVLPLGGASGRAAGTNRLSGMGADGRRLGTPRRVAFVRSAAATAPPAGGGIRPDAAIYLGAGCLWSGRPGRPSGEWPDRHAARIPATVARRVLDAHSRTQPLISALVRAALAAAIARQARRQFSTNWLRSAFSCTLRPPPRHQ
jgi:hypothetical protein